MENSQQAGSEKHTSMALILIALCFVSVFYVYRETALAVFELWFHFDTSMGHGLLVALTCIYLFYKSDAWRGTLAVKPFLPGVILLSLCSLGWGIAHIAGINIIEQLLVPLILLSAMLLLTGRSITQKLFIPVLFIYFALPIWDYLNDYLLQLTVIVVQQLVRWTNITAYIEGSSIYLPTGEILIASGCSGLRYFIVGCFLSSLSAYLFYSSRTVRVSLVLMCIALSILANWVRVYAITIIAHVSEMQSPIVQDHETLGWIVFMIFMIPLFYINYHYSNQHEENTAATAPVPATAGKVSQLAAIVLLLLAVYSGPLLVSKTDYDSHYQLQEIVQLPEAMAGWKKQAGSESDFAWGAGFKLPENYLFTVYENEAADIGLFVFPYLEKSESGDILPYIEGIYNLNSWSLNRQQEVWIDGVNSHFVKHFITNKGNQQKLLLAYQYNIGGEKTSKYKLAKLLQIPAILTRQAYAVLTVATIPCEFDCEQAEHELDAFLQAAHAAIEHVR